MSYPESEVHPHHPDERAHLYGAADGGTIEDEFGELLAALVRCWKPGLVLETGTYRGRTTRLLAEACARNGVVGAPGKGVGRVFTVEAIPTIAYQARKNLQHLDNVKLIEVDSVAYLGKVSAGTVFDLAVLDSDLRARVEELKLIRDRGLVKGPVFVHDTSRLRAAGGLPDWPEYPAALDALGLGGVECPFARGWRLFSFPQGGVHVP